MFPKATTPVLQLSMDYSRPPSEHYALGQQLAQLRNRGVLIVGSGNMVHNLRAVQRNVGDNQAYDWAKEFDSVIGDQIAKGQLDALQNFLKLGEVAKMAYPTVEHFLPLLYAAGAAKSTEMPRFFNTGFQAASISMRSVLWG
jgi:4,5-DOPA dioxygenase extradiol